MFGLVKAGVSLIWMCCLPPLRYLATAWKLLLRSDGPLHVSRFPSCGNYVSDSQGEINTTRHIFSVVSHLWVIVPLYANEEMWEGVNAG